MWSPLDTPSAARADANLSLRASNSRKVNVRSPSITAVLEPSRWTARLSMSCNG